MIFRLEEELPWEKTRSTYGEIVATDDPLYIEAMQVADNAKDALNDATDDILKIHPTTIAGVAAMLGYYANSLDEGEETYFSDGFYVDLTRHAAAALERLSKSGA